jgi:hypothetical protein
VIEQSRCSNGRAYLIALNTSLIVLQKIQIQFTIDMMRYLFAALLFHSWSRTESLAVGHIYDAVMLSNSSTLVSISDSAYACVCAMLLATNIVGVSYFSNRTCVAIHNYSLSYALMGSPNSSYYFLSIPSEQQQTTRARTTYMPTST